jgi:hypothetical protein
VTFDIDANGLVHVSAKYLGTGKERSIQIAASRRKKRPVSDWWKNKTDSLIYSALRPAITSGKPKARPMAADRTSVKVKLASGPPRRTITWWTLSLRKLRTRRNSRSNDSPGFNWP